MILSIILLIVSAALILWGADRLTEGASGIARRLGMSDLVVGLTVVSFGTSLPEFVVSFVGVLDGASDISVGNIVGSNLFNTLVIVGCSAMVCPIAVRRSTVIKDIPFVQTSTILLSILVMDTMFSGSLANTLSRSDGLVLLLFFLIFMTYTVAITDDKAEQDSMSEMPMWKSLAWIAVGLVCLVVGGQLFVDNATAIALRLGVSELIVGMTIAAGGTSLPELATSMVAASKGRSAMAIGNVIGSNVFNILFVLGTCATTYPLSVDSLSMADLIVLLGSVFLFWFFARSRYRIGRTEGVILLLLYLIYIILKITL